MVNTYVMTAVYARLENRPGALAKATRAIADRHINVDTLSVETVGEGGFARFYTPRPREVVSALRSVGIDAFESPTVIASLPDRPGELAVATAELAAAGINIESVTATPDGRLAIRTNDVERTEQILRKL